MTFNPRAFVKTAKQTWDDKLSYDKFVSDNAHLAAPFHITGLEDVLPKRLPGETTVHFAKSHHGKSTALRNDKFKAQIRIEDTDFLIGDVSLEDTSEMNAAKIVQRYGGNPLHFQDDQVVFIGRSFGMDTKIMGQLNLENVIECLEEGLRMLPSKKGYAQIFVDYAQKLSQSDEADPEPRRQMRHFAQGMADAAVRFRCPVDFACQALLKQPRDAYTSTLRIPGAADLKEAGELYEIPDIAIAYWQPKHEPNTPVGSLIEDGNWSFRVEPNLIFIRVAKWRNSELKGFVGEKDVVGRVFPCWIKPDGEIFYDQERHRHMQMKPMPQDYTV